MRKKFVSILVVLCMLANLCGCATATTAPTVSATSEVAAENGTTGAPAAELAGESVRNTQANQDERGDLGFDEETDTDASAGASEEGGNPSVTPPEPEPEPEPKPEPEPEVVAPEHGQYSYTVGDTTVYTEHDIERWLTPYKYPGDFILSLGQMLGEVWQMSGMDNAAGYSFYEGDESKWLSFDDEEEDVHHSVKISWRHDGTEGSVTAKMIDCPYENPYCHIIESRIYNIDKELAILILVMAERLGNDPSHFTLEDLDLGPNFDVSYY